MSNKLGSYLKKLASSRQSKVILPTGGRKLDYAEVKNTCNGCLLYKRVLSIVTKLLQLEMLTGNDLLVLLTVVISLNAYFLCTRD